MNINHRIICIPEDRFPANFINAAFQETNETLPENAPVIFIVIPDIDTASLSAGIVNTLNIPHPSQAILLASSQIYGEKYDCATEDNEPQSTKWHETERHFLSACDTNHTPATILRLPPLVGTAMTGLNRRRVNAIYRSLYRHIEGVEAHQSILHALDIPGIITILENHPGGIYNISDLTTPTTREITEALSVRLDRKRIYTIKARWARLIARIADILGIQDLGRHQFIASTSTRTLDTTRFTTQFPHWQPTDTLNHLRNHTYSPLDT